MDFWIKNEKILWDNNENCYRSFVKTCLQPCLDIINHHPTECQITVTPLLSLYFSAGVLLFFCDFYCDWRSKMSKKQIKLWGSSDFCYQTLMLNEEVLRRKWRRSGEACAEQREKTHCMTDMACNAYGILCLLFWPDTNGCWCQAVSKVSKPHKVP